MAFFCSSIQFLMCEMLAKGATNRQIAATLFIAEGTVRNHLTNILGKLGVSDRTQAAVKAKELGLV
jgi:DNA-binding NarL/FixJ family response regulator